ncbi:hypothetical protein [Actinoplanes derwentensis]|uniref:Uncharacterized protein n=1 Tax=Actinoplanes derwentensis TaxID=113562 RepID=A0A1H1ZIY6_9ACTN|nr:hypothetical protein [Actinoplanes derwentensis]GID82469.1 hypothetical protein Ade03nite_13930 [Actinoplanes derwentensis]SDT33755.1 hypothetical protein SAMN04489716_3350 [Actinoplanes derwentensis]
MSEIVRDALHQVESAARLYGVGEENIAGVREFLSSQHPNDRGTYACAVLDRVVTEIAYNHRTECDGNECRTCDGLQEALTVAVASVRSMIADEMTWRKRRRNRRWFWNR